MNAYQHITFIDGSNPYICKTEKSFKWMKEHYVLEPLAKNFWKATYKISYLVVGFDDKNKNATFNRSYKSKSGALNAIRKALSENKFEAVTLRREKVYLNNDDSLEISSSTPICHWEDGKTGGDFMREIMNYIINNMRGKHKGDIEDYVHDCYDDGSITEMEFDDLCKWIDTVYEPVLSWR